MKAYEMRSRLYVDKPNHPDLIQSYKSLKDINDILVNMNESNKYSA